MKDIFTKKEQSDIMFKQIVSSDIETHKEAVEVVCATYIPDRDIDRSAIAHLLARLELHYKHTKTGETNIVIDPVEIFRGDGDTDPSRIYIQSLEVEDWICFPVEKAEEVIAAIRELSNQD